MVRRPVAWVLALVLFAEALGIAGLNWILGNVVDSQDMSLAGLDSGVMSMSSKLGGLVFGAYFALCGLVALLVGLRDRAPAGLGRILLISAAVVHGLLGAFVWGLVGRTAFLFMMVVLGLLVLLLVSYDAQGGPGEPADAVPDGGEGAGGSPVGGPPAGGSPVSPPPAPTTP